MDAEQTLLAELERLEKGGATLQKGGDALQNQPHDGGFATEGTNIQSKANVKKALAALVKGGMSEEEAKKTIESISKGMGDDDSSSLPPDGDDETSSPEEDTQVSGDAPMQKSLGAAQLANASSKRGSKEETIRKSLSEETNNVINAIPVLGELVKTIDTLSKSVRGQGDAELRKSVTEMRSTQQAFNDKVAKALSLIAKSVFETRELVKAIESQPIVQTRAPTLRKGDIVEPQFHGNDQNLIGGNGGLTEASPLTNVPMLKIQEALVDICMKGGNGVDVMDVTRFENSKGDLTQLPKHVVELLEKRLCSAA